MPRKPAKKKYKPSELLLYQIAVYINRNLYKSDAAAERARVRAMREFLKTGRVQTRGVKIVARWRNPDNRNAVHRAWKTTEDAGQSLSDFFKTLHKQRGALRALAARYL